MIPMDSKLLFPKGCSLEQFLGGGGTALGIGSELEYAT